VPRRRHVAAACFALWTVLSASGAQAEGFRVTTWNLEWFTQRPAGDPLLPPDVFPKQDGDIAVLARYAARLNPAVAALEEVDDPALLARLFPPDRYRILITHDPVAQRVALAVRRDITVQQNADLRTLDVTRPGSRRHLRSGLDATLIVGGRTLRVLGVHLKSGCWDRPYEHARQTACRQLAEQLPVLQDWVAARRAEGVPFLVLGDFNRQLKERDPFLAALRGNGPLASATAGRASPCWGGEDFIDQILAGGVAARWMEPGTLRVMVFHETGADMKERLSDHCPVSIELDPDAGAGRGGATSG